MELTINNSSFKRLFLDQISRVSENCVLVVENDRLISKACTSDNSIILGIQYKVKQVRDLSDNKINIGDIKKLIKAFDCIGKDEITFTVDKNHISYKDEKIQFKYHLLENDIISQPKINLDKLESIEFDSTFTITDSVLGEILKASTFSTDSNKIYLTSKDGLLKGNLTDRSRYNVDSFEVVVSEEFNGTGIENLCLNFEIFRLLSFCKFNLFKCKVSSKLGVVLFTFDNNILTTKYIVSALTK